MLRVAVDLSEVSSSLSNKVFAIATVMTVSSVKLLYFKKLFNVTLVFKQSTSFSANKLKSFDLNG